MHLAAVSVLLAAAGAFFSPAPATAAYEPEPIEPGTVQTGTATWYGNVDGRVCVQGRRNTCSPYLTRYRLGVKLEMKWYAATGYFRVYHIPAYQATVCGPLRCVVVQVRDECSGCRKWARKGEPSRRLIDLSPWAFEAACGALSRGVCKVTVLHYSDQAAKDERTVYRRGMR